jgi:hypothetical protein
LKEKCGNGFKFIQNEPLEQKLFKYIDPDLSKRVSPSLVSDPSILFQFFGSQLDMDLIKSNKSAYIDHVKNLLPNHDSRKEII